MSSGGFGFGSPSGFNTSTNLFSQNRPGGLFGTSTNTASPLGSGTPTGTTGGLFGSSQPAASTTPSTFSFGGGVSAGAQQQQQAGTGHVKFAPTTGQDTISKNGTTTNITTNHQCITAMKEYEGKSLEELRLEDYQANRKFAQATSQFGGGGSLFSSGGTSSGFSSSGGLFGSSGASTAPKPFGTFGSNTPTTQSTPVSTGLFGSTTTTANRPFTGFGAGTTTATTTTTTSSPFSGFGSQPATTSTFGSTQPAQQTSLFGGLGSGTSATGTTGGLFGSSSTTSTTQPGGLFGSSTTTANKPLFGFGSSTTTTTAQPTSQFSFGGASTTTSTTTPSTGLFGQSTLTQSPQTKPFGTSTFGGFGSTGATTTTTGFGSTATTTTPSTGLFGSTTQPKPAFGLGTTTGTTGTTGFGGFGSTGTTSTTGTTGGGIFGGFGSTTSTQPATTTASPFGTTTGLGTTTTTSTPFGGGGIFGSTAQPSTGTATTTGGGLFGSQPTTGFGSTGLGGFGQQQTTAATTTTPSIFGSTTGGLCTTGGGLFGSTTTQPTSTFGSGLTGASTGLGTGATSGGLFGLGGSTTTTTGLGSGLSGLSTGFGQAQQQPSLLQQQQQQQQLQQAQTQPLVQQQLLALSNSPYGTASLLKSTLQDYSKKDDIFKPVSPIAQRQYIAEATSPPKVGASQSFTSLTSDFKGGLSQTLKLTPKPLSQVSLNKKTDLFEGLEDEEAPVFYPRKNIKKLLFKPPSETSISRRSSATSSLNGDIKYDFMKKPIFSDESLRQNENINTTAQSNFKFGQITHDLTNVSDDGAANGDNQSEISNNPNQAQPHPANIVLERPGYFTIPSLQDLATLTDSKGDCIVENFAIGRVDYGCITFPGPTNLANLNLDEIVHIRRKEVHVYPDDSKKPPVGQGLNKPAEVTLHRIWPSDKLTKMPITDPNIVISMGFNKKLEKATIEMDAQFIDYDPVTGSWTFKVKHFSKYGLNDSDDEDEQDTKTMGLKTAKAKLDLISEQQSIEKDDMKKEKEMIQKQLKLIELRRAELMQARKAGMGSNLNSITNQQWDIINEYCVPPGASEKQKKRDNKYIDNSNLHLELSSDEDAASDTENEQNLEDKKSIRKALILDNENETSDNETEENKENNRLYPSLKELKKSSKKQSKLSKPKEKLYPNLSETFGQQQVEMEDKENLNLIDETAENYEERMDDLPFFAGSRANRKLVDAFFNQDRDSEDFYTNTVEEDSGLAKFGGFNQKPITVGLLKRGLGGMSTLTQDNKLSIGETNVLSASLKGDMYHGQTKVTKQHNVVSLSLADVQQKIGSKVLKPKLWNRFLTQKTSKLGLNKNAMLADEFSDEKTNQLVSNDKRMQALNINSSESNQIVPKLIELEHSIANNRTWYLADAGLFNARRFRVNWSVHPTAFTFTQLSNNPKNATFRNMIQLSTPCMINLGNSNLNFDPTNPRLATIKENTQKYLNIQLNLSEFVSSKNADCKLPQVRIKPGNELLKQMSQCTDEIRTSIGDNPDADNTQHMKYVWNLCVSLWGDIPESYKSNAFDSTQSAYESEQIRKRLLSEWLVQVSSHRIEKEIKVLKFNKNKENYLNSIFSHLTGNNVLEACNIAVENSDFRMALLMAQSSGSNDTVRNMMRKQLKEWFDSNSDKFINLDRLKLFLLVAGELVYNLSGQKGQLINVCESLDWKRQFGLHLWYHCLPIHSIADALNFYEKSVQSDICNKPVPSYIEDTLNPESEKFKNLYDTCYHLIKLYCDNSHPIEDIINPLNHTSNQLDFRLSWHLLMALIALQYNHVQKFSLETLHDSYASQLESIGLWHWSIFVLMHIEDEKRREKFVRNYLSKNVTSSSDLTENEKFLIEKLNVPCEWIYEYKALRAKYEHQYANQLQLLLKAHKWNEAHTVLIEQLAPDLFIKQNFKTLYSYLSTLHKENVYIGKWNTGGQIYLDFIRLNQKAQVLFNFSTDDSNEKLIDDEIFKEIQNQLLTLSSRIKEFDTKTPKKLLCCLEMSKLLLKYFNAFNEMNNSTETDQQLDDSSMVEKSRDLKILNKLIVEKATHQTERIPDQDLIGTMLLQKLNFTKLFLMPKSRY